MVVQEYGKTNPFLDIIVVGTPRLTGSNFLEFSEVSIFHDSSSVRVKQTRKLAPSSVSLLLSGFQMCFNSWSLRSYCHKETFAYSPKTDIMLA